MLSKICEKVVPVVWAEATGSGYWHCTHSGCEAWPAAPVHAAVRARVKIQCDGHTTCIAAVCCQQAVLCQAWAEWAGRRDQGGNAGISRGNGIGTPHHPSYPSRLDFSSLLFRRAFGHHDVPGRIIHCVPRDVASDASAQRSQHRCILQVIWRSIRQFPSLLRVSKEVELPAAIALTMSGQEGA